MTTYIDKTYYDPRFTDIKLILDFIPNHTSNESEWFKKSVQRIDPYTNYYVWKGPSGWNGSVPVPPNNWVIMLFHTSTECD